MRGGTGRDRGEAFHMHGAGTHAFGHAGTGIAAHENARVLVHAPSVVAGMTVDLDFYRRIDAHGDAVRAVRVEDSYFLHAAEAVVQELVQFAQRLPGQVESGGIGRDVRRLR